MMPSEMTAVAVAPRVEIRIFESLPRVRVEKGKQMLVQFICIASILGGKGINKWNSAMLGRMVLWRLG
jgi:hypothetical protein